jgi:hypothetical protein
MAGDSHEHSAYEPPAIEDRAEIGKPLIGASGPN